MDFEDDFEINGDELIQLSEAAEKKLLPEQQSTEPGPEHLEVLSKYFGHVSFRPLQWEIISSIIIHKRDVCAIMCTGYGKSLCFQFPSVFSGGITLVISPLIALMEDQVLSLTVANIPAVLLGTAQEHPAQVISDIFKNQYSLIYLTPEFCTGETGAEMLRRMNNELTVTLIAVDEAHCISSWGHDFRYQYRKLGFLHYTFPSVPIIAVTATATRKVREDIIQNLNLRNPLLVCSGFDRPNLYFEVYPKSEKRIFADLKKIMVCKNSVWQFSGPTIIYCITRKQTQEVSDLLRSHGINSLPYHAGLPLKLRKETHEQFVRDQIDVVVATIAFGMGIDKPDIANIIHYGASKSIENYYQEVGRAGRDGNPARCVAFFCDFDFYIIRRIEAHIKTNVEERAAKLELMEKYLTSRDCRRRFILSYFEDTKTGLEGPQPNCCDNCTRRCSYRRPENESYEGLDENGRYDFSYDVRIILDTVASLDVPFGVTTYTAFIRGGQESKLRTHSNHPLYGIGKDRPNQWWKALVQILIEENYLREIPEATFQGFIYNTLELTEQGSALLSELNRNETKFLHLPSEPILKLLKSKPQRRSGSLNATKSKINQPSTIVTEPETPADIERRMKLYQQLVNKRTELAAELDCMPYMVASNTALMKISAHRPRTLNEMRQLNLEGFTQAKLKKFGEYFLQIVNKMVVDQQNNVSTSSSTDNNQKKQSIKDILDRHPLPQNSALTFSAGVTCALYQSGLNVDDISIKRKLSLQVVTSHLISGIMAGYPIKMADLGVTKQYRDDIVKVLNKYYSNTGFTDVIFKTIKDECPPAVTIDHIKTVVAYLKVRYHLEQLNIPYEEFENFKFCEMRDVNKPGPSSINIHDALTQVTNKENLKLANILKREEKIDEPPIKREKKDYNSLILDSPPHTIVFDDDAEVITIIIDDDDADDIPQENLTPVIKPKKKEKALPPWLVKKKIN